MMLALLSAAMAFGQNTKEKVAIYTTDETGKDYAEFAGIYLTDIIVKRGIYDAVERTSDFLSLLSKEQGYQRSGAVSDEHIAKLGVQLGVQYVCAVKIGLMGSQPFISAKLIDVETSGIKGTSRPIRFADNDFDSFEEACRGATNSIFGERGSSRATSGGAISSSSGNQTNGAVYNPDGIEMIYVEGSGSGLLARKSFYIGKYEVTQAQWQAVMGNNPSKFSGSNNPVEQVSWNDVQEFIKKLNAMTGRNYRLPTEAEWEYAANEGKRNSSYEYSGSNTLSSVGWYGDNSGNTTHPVGQKSPNSLGLYDMSGNVWEWCQDCYDSSCSYRVIRGGSWYYDASNCRVAHRYGNAPSYRYGNLGFRLVLP
jgi:hypothetical protein